MSMRSCAVIALVLTAAAGTSANAAPKVKPKPKPVCNLVVDDKGDAKGAPLGQVDSPTGNEPAYDIVGGDIASDAKTITAVVRVDKLAKATNNSPTGLQWRMDFAVSGITQVLFLQASTMAVKDAFTFGYVDTTSHAYTAGATGFFDTAKNEVRISAPIAAAAAQGKIAPGAKITAITISAGRWYNTAGGNPSLSEATDDAAASKSYVAGSSSCVAVGK